MKRVVSVSLGSASRDHQATLTLLGETIQIERRGTEGDLSRARSLIRDLDGTVDAIGLGGIDRYLIVNQRRYEIQDALQLVQAASQTPVVDGSGIKDTLERTLIQELHENRIIHPSESVLMVSAMDRFGMAETFYRLGYSLVAGDLIFSSHINYPIRTADELEELARKLLPELAKMPFQQLYPVGSAQTEESDSRYAGYFDQADIIAGDFHYIRRYMPKNLQGKLIITNTTTRQDVELLKSSGARLLVTTTPILDGRSYGTNVMEAALLAISGLSAEDARWTEWVKKTGLRGSIQELKG